MPQSITDFIPIEELDADGALAEGAGALENDSRADFFRKAGVMGAGLATSGLLLGGIPELSFGKSSALAQSDVDILNYALTLEYLESTFYNQAAQNLNNKFSTQLRALTSLVRSHEATHVKALKGILGSKAIKKPKFNFHGTTKDLNKYKQTAFVLENTGVHAYLGQVTRIKSKAVLKGAGTIVTIEARHASAFGLVVHHSIKGKNGITPNGAFDTPFTMKTVTNKQHAGYFLA